MVGLYDPLVAKLIVWDTDRERARRRMLRALDEYTIEGVTTLVGFHRALLEHPCFVAGETCFGLVESIAEGDARRRGARRACRRRRAFARRSSASSWTAAASRSPSSARSRRTPSWPGAGASGAGRPAHHAAAREAVVSPMQGTVLAVEVAEGDEMREGQVICVVEAMKMENEITAHRSGRVTGLSVAPGEPVTTGQVICVVAQEGEDGDVSL